MTTLKPQSPPHITNPKWTPGVEYTTVLSLSHPQEYVFKSQLQAIIQLIVKGLLSSEQTVSRC